jgi:hypothetical protein
MTQAGHISSQPSVNTPIGLMLNFEVIDLQNRDNNGVDAINVLTANKEFDLWLSFRGTGSAWELMEFVGVQYEVVYYADRELGPAENINLGTVSGTLIPNKGTYGDPDTILKAVIKDPGIYELSAVVTFFAVNPVTQAKWVVKGVTGFAEELVVQTYEG